MSAETKQRLEAHLIAGGMAHDFDFARLELLKILGEDERVRTKVSSSWEEFEGEFNSLLISYTCNIVPSDRTAEQLKEFIEGGGRWIALHATNSLLEWTEDGVVCAPANGPFLGLIGSAFQGHPPLGKYTVANAAPDHPLVENIGNFEVEDELYLSDFSAPAEVLLSARFGGSAPGFTREHWEETDHPVMYIRKLGKGEILYLTLGHARGHYDAPHRTPYFPEIERGAWQTPEMYELIRRSVLWGLTPQMERNSA
ncbi:hypothetical protein SAMN02745824_1526 [Parasphingorhabdus marina DSM 22363]|uniref:ThuA-like domain-containing protein n=1 Tax=Parasphingorhabdus marina DSM 22363 TaxID=1123272 RepID=A0A1N6D492_9SPHN|nr:ThuA domain-containing protein [Parasphingorhabdus marina]SIN65612.1 hypothetical protein SAMN02745824_1526 [Parasphingorhabdus marina DSM 22363]